MKAYPLDADRETLRLQELERLNVLRDEPDLDLDLIVRVTAAIFGVHVALVSIVGEHRLWLPTSEGVRFPPLLRLASFCAFAIEMPDRVFVVADTHADPRFLDHPLVAGDPHARFYAGAPLTSRRGFALGTLCVLDLVPRQLSDEQCALLQKLAAVTVDVLEDAGAERRNVSQRRLAMFDSVVVNAVDAVMIIESAPGRGGRQRIVYVNDAFTAMTGYTAAESIGNTLAMLRGPETDPRETARLDDALASGKAVVSELTQYRKDGTPVRIECNLSPVSGSDGSCLYFLAVKRDVTERRALEKYERDRSVILEMAIRNESLDVQLARLVTLLADVVPGSRGTVMLADGDRLGVGAADPRLPKNFLAAIDGLPIAPASGVCGSAVYHRAPAICEDVMTDERCRPYTALADRFGIHACWSLPCFSADGEAIGSYALYIDRAAQPTAAQMNVLAETARFVSLVLDRHRDRMRLERMASRDPVTDLPNRRFVEERLAEAIVRARDTGTLVGVGVLDVLRFRTINDAFGHHIGDRLLRAVADRLATLLPIGATLGRASGDVFLVVLPDLAGVTEGITAATRLIDAFNGIFTIDDMELTVRASLGLAFYPQTSIDASNVFVAADRAMLAAKAQRARLQVASPTASGSALMVLDLEHALPLALVRGELDLHYQLIFDLADGRPAGAEALLRWNHPRLGLIAPADFIPLAEANGEIVPIGAWVIDEAVRTAREWQEQGRDAFITVNVSALQFDEPGLVETVTAALTHWDLEPHRLHLELTESLLMRNATASAAMLLQLRSLGVKIVIDDFGTGYSSLAYLQRFAFDALKIDRTFVRGIGEPAMAERSQQIIAAVVHFGRALGVTTIAEGVENGAQYAFVQSCGCAFVQGFLSARPVPAAQIDWSHFFAALPVRSRYAMRDDSPVER